MSPLLSILIPCYERPDYLRRALDSIQEQSFRDFEVVITDDSASDIIQSMIEEHTYDYSIHYQRNRPALGTPRNWTAGLGFAKGEWIKILHDDDWLASPDSLSTYVQFIDNTADIIFSGYVAVYEDSGKKVDRCITAQRFEQLIQNPFRLCAGNLIGPPSVMMFRRSMSVAFDPNLKWIVDWEGYIRMILTHQVKYIPQSLIHMSYNATQVTNVCFGDPAVEIPEYLTFYSKHGVRARSGWLVYDAWWRLIRNLGIRSRKQLDAYAGGKNVPAFLYHIICHQQFLPNRFWKIGAVSKLGMFISYLINR